MGLKLEGPNLPLSHKRQEFLKRIKQVTPDPVYFGPARAQQEAQQFLLWQPLSGKPLSCEDISVCM